MSVNAFKVLLGFLLTVYVTASLVQQPLEVSMDCVTEGRFPHPKDCGSFVDCLPDDAGGLRARQGSCNGLAYHSTLKKCVHLNKADGCQPRSARSLVAKPELDFVCEGSTSEFVCSDCKTLVNCVNGTAYPDPCGPGDLCSVRDADFGGGVCYPGEPRECSCERPNEFKADLYSAGRFFFCEGEASEPSFYDCPEGGVFDPASSQCRSFAGLPECTRIGVFADPADCTRYYTCIFTTAGWLQKAFSCDNGTLGGGALMYSEESGRCEDPCGWDAGTFACASEGRFPDPLRCDSYYECVADAEREGGFRQLTHRCPEGFEWDPRAREGFGHCVRRGFASGECVPLSATECDIPEDLCA